MNTPRLLWSDLCPGVLDIEYWQPNVLRVSCLVEEDMNIAPGLERWVHWVDGGSPTFSRTEDRLVISGSSAQDRGRWFTGRDIAVEAETEYHISGILSGNGTDALPISLVVTWWNAELQYIAATTALPELTTAGTVIAQARVQPPAGAVYARMEFRAFQGLVGSAAFGAPYFAADLTLDEKLIARGELEQVIQFNPDAALQKRIFADGFVPNSPEFDITHNEGTYRGQRAEHLQSGEVRVYYAAVGDWGNVLYVVRP